MLYPKRHHVILLISAIVPRGTPLENFELQPTPIPSSIGVQSSSISSPSSRPTYWRTHINWGRPLRFLLALQWGGILEASRIGEPKHLRFKAQAIRLSHLKPQDRCSIPSGCSFYLHATCSDPTFFSTLESPAIRQRKYEVCSIVLVWTNLSNIDIFLFFLLDDLPSTPTIPRILDCCWRLGVNGTRSWRRWQLKEYRIPDVRGESQYVYLTCHFLSFLALHPANMILIFCLHSIPLLGCPCLFFGSCANLASW